MSKIGIVGGSGYVGSSLAKYLTKSFEVKVLDIFPLPEALRGTVEYHKCDIRKYVKVHEGLCDVDVVIHTAIIQIPAINKHKKLGYEINILGTQNVCRTIEKNRKIKGMILCGSWHTMGERDLRGTIDEEFGFRPDKVEDRARLYVLSKIAQESIVRFYAEMSEKIYGIIKMGTVLGERMPKETAANIFIENALKGRPITPFKHSMHRPMLYVDIWDVCKAFNALVAKILSGELDKKGNSLDHLINVFYPKPITIIELAEIVKKAVIKCTNNRVKPEIDIMETGHPMLFSEESRKQIKTDISKALNFLGLKNMISPKKSIERIVSERINFNFELPAATDRKLVDLPI